VSIGNVSPRGTLLALDGETSLWVLIFFLSKDCFYGKFIHKGKMRWVIIYLRFLY
jgi:hypothetical protein